MSATVQGCGAIGGAVIRGLAAHGLTLSVADVDLSRAEQIAAQSGSEAILPDTVLTQEADVLVPCALGGILTCAAVDKLKVSIVCGAANNILANEDAERALRARGLVWVPDVIASAGAVVRGIARTVMGIEDPTHLVDRLGEVTYEVLSESQQRESLASEVIADRVRARMVKAGVALEGFDG